MLKRLLPCLALACGLLAVVGAAQAQTNDYFIFSDFHVLLLAVEGRAELLEGQVVDARTGRPIEGAVVLARWPNGHDTEAETDSRGRFALDRPAGISSGQDLVIAYKFGYVVWTNTDVFDPRDRPPYLHPRADTRVPSKIMLDPFPPDGNRARQVWVLSWILEGDGHPERRPKLRSAVQREIEEARKMCAPNCD